MQRFPILFLAAVACLGSLDDSILRAQTPTPRPPESSSPPADELFETVEVEVVNLDVLALDGSGQPVTDLTLDDFDLRVDGAPMSIGYFAAPSAPQPAAAAPVENTAILALLVDLEDMRPGPRNDVLRQVRPLVAARLKSGDRVLVAVFQGSLRLLSDATSDAAAVEAALAEIERSAPKALHERIQSRNLQREIEMVDLDDPNAPNEAQRLQGELENLATAETNRYQRVLGAMTDLLGTLAAVDGPKTLLWVGESVPDRPITALANRWERRLADLIQIGSRTIDVEPDVQRLRRARLAVARAAQASRSTFFVLDDPDNASGGVNAEAERSDTSVGGEATRSLADLAEGSGGRQLTLSPELGTTLTKVSDELSTRYSLGFTPSGPTDERWHRIELRCRRPGITLRHRAGFLRRGEGDSLAEAALAAASLGAPEQNPLGFTVEIKPLPPAESGKGKKSGGARRVPVVVRIPLGRLTLVPESAQHVGRLELQFATRDRSGQLTRYDARELPLQVPNARLAGALRQALAYEIEMLLTPGSYRLAVAVQDRIGGVRGAAAVNVEIPGTP